MKYRYRSNTNHESEKKAEKNALEGWFCCSAIPPEKFLAVS